MAEGYVGGAWLGEIIAALRDLGYDADRLLTGLPGKITATDGSVAKLEIGSVRRLYHRIDRLADDPLLGIKLASRIDDGALGFLGVLLWHAPTLGHVLDNVIRFQWSLSENGGYVSSQHDDREGRVRVYEYVPVENVIEGNRHQSLAVVASSVMMIRRVTRRQRDIAWLRLPRSLDADAIGQKLGCECRTTPGHAAFAVAESDLKTPISRRDDELYSLVMQHAISVSQRRDSRRDLVEDIRAAISENGYASASLLNVETAVGIHRRLVQRSLADMHLSYREIKEEVVRDKAIALLLNSDRSSGSIATILGYSEPSAFHRAFRSWFGMTPQGFRESETYVS